MCCCSIIIITDKYAEIPLGIYVVRGDNVVLLGELDEEEGNNNNNIKLYKVEPDELAQIAQDVEESSNNNNNDKQLQIQWDYE